MDRVDAKTRSRIMSQIRGRDTRIELAVKPILEALGFVYQPKGLASKPDFAHLEKKVALFLDGCFWHGCPKHCRTPQVNLEFWSRKIASNRARDAKGTATLEADGWRVIRVWEHDLRHILPKRPGKGSK